MQCSCDIAFGSHPKGVNARGMVDKLLIAPLWIGRCQLAQWDAKQFGRMRDPSISRGAGSGDESGPKFAGLQGDLAEVLEPIQTLFDGTSES